MIRAHAGPGPMTGPPNAADIPEASPVLPGAVPPVRVQARTLDAAGRAIPAVRVATGRAPTAHLAPA
ncbi:hypothetical protein ACFXNW_02080 [Nocardia sp. NPDC059180]|uniref:hypothetical protein n=1 Tax=Nocardia sp. NPDC059180 TaxID=3346761 RepID=UPI003673CED1